MDYSEFIESKRLVSRPEGFEPGEMAPMLFDFQRDIVRWACRKGKAAIFADCGLGKTAMQLEWARQVCDKTGGMVLVLAPLAVAKQTAREGERFGIPVTVCRTDEDLKPGINVTNYEMLRHYDPSIFAGVVLDESSILKSYDGKTRTQIIDSFKSTPYRLACTATPAPNDYMELGNHAEFLGTMTRAEMLAMFFIHDGGDTAKWRIKGHGEDAYWRWVASWACVMRKPSDLGYDDGKFTLPGLDVREHVVSGHVEAVGTLFALSANTLAERRIARRASVGERVASCATLANASKDQWIVWCDLNVESHALAQEIVGAVEISGSDTPEHKESTMLAFAAGKVRVMVTKPSIAGFGMNFQNCSRMAFVGLSDSYESYYQAVRRCWRFGQKRSVEAHIIISDLEGAVVSNIARKEKDSETMMNSMAEHTRAIVADNLKATSRSVSEYRTEQSDGENWRLSLQDCVDGVREMPTDSVHYSVFSPPFASLYTYSNSDRDMGNSKGEGEFAEHMEYLIGELYRVLMPGRLLSFHCMNLPTQKGRQGYIGISDFRGDLIRSFQRVGFIYHSEVVIWKDPVTAMQRTKALGLLHKQIKKDSCMSRQGIPDYLVTMRKPGENPEPVTHTNETFPVKVWQRYASPIWMDINPSDTLQYRAAREDEDERHICPLQLQVIERAIDLWTNPGDTVLSPFAGIGSEGYVALQKARRFVGFELKESYYRLAVKNLIHAESQKHRATLFDSQEEEVAR
jgi:DNA modification methylase